MPSPAWKIAAEELFERHRALLRLPEEYRLDLTGSYSVMASHIAERARDKGSCLVVGLAGAQGTGKSTLTFFIERLLRAVAGLRVVTLSLDDFYLARQQRQELAETIHPLLITRGVPGTHDIALLRSTIAALRSADALRSVAASDTTFWPRFDKATDERLALTDRHHVVGPCDVVLLEGWCVGASAESVSSLEVPVNSLEEQEDPDGIWRRYVNTALEGPYAELFRELDYRVFLRAPDLQSVVVWRTEQEDKLRAAKPEARALLDEGAVRRFVAHFERLTRHMLSTMPDEANLVVSLDRAHRVDNRGLSVGIST